MGAGSGVGRELALHLCQLGVTVACVDINVESCNVTVQRALQLHGKCKRYQCDVRDNNEVPILYIYIFNCVFICKSQSHIIHVDTIALIEIQ